MTKKALFLKWIKNLFYVQCVALVGIVIGQIPIIGSWFKWITTIVAIGEVYCLYQLMSVNERYRKAAIFSGIAVGLIVVANVIDFGLFSIIISICSIIGLYQEFNGHSEILLTIDNRLSKKWHTLFYWNLFGGIIVALISVPVVVIASLAVLFDANVISVLAVLVAASFSLILQIVYLVYLKRTYKVCETYEFWIDDVVRGEEI